MQKAETVKGSDNRRKKNEVFIGVPKTAEFLKIELGYQLGYQKTAAKTDRVQNEYGLAKIGLLAQLAENKRKSARQ